MTKHTHVPFTCAVALVAAALLGAAGSPAVAGTVSYSASVPLTYTDFASSVTVPKFDPSLGVLETVYVSVSSHIEGTAGYENLSGGPNTITVTLRANVKVLRPDNSEIVNVLPELTIVKPDVPAFDGIPNYGGTSGGTVAGVSGATFTSHSAPPPESDLVLFTGPGDITLPVTALGTSRVTDTAGNVTQYVITQANADITVIYTYGPGDLTLLHLGDRVWYDTDADGEQDAGEPGINGVTVTLVGDVDNDGVDDTLTTTTATVGSVDGYYLFEDLWPNKTYTVTVSGAPLSGLTQTYDLDGTATADTAQAPLPQSRTDVDFGYVKESSGPFFTYTQGGWGAKPAGNNPGMLLKNNFARVYPSGVNIGRNPKYELHFTCAKAIEVYLPQGGTPGVLKANATDPKSTKTTAGVFAGQVLALQLSVDFSAAGITTPGLGGLVLAKGPLAGQTISQVLWLANQVLGGNLAALPAGMTISNLNDVVTALNENFDNGTTNNGYVIVP